MTEVVPAPDTYLGVAVPDPIRAAWRRWEGLEWRKHRNWERNGSYMPDLRFGLSPPHGMCQLHIGYWYDYRNMQFDAVSGNEWPGHPGTFLSPNGIGPAAMERLCEIRRVEWDQKASKQMRLIEDICLSGRSPQCERDATVSHPAEVQGCVGDAQLRPSVLAPDLSNPPQLVHCDPWQES